MFDFAPSPPATALPLQQSSLFADALTAAGVDAISHVLPGGRALVIRRRWPGIGTVGLISRGPVWTGRRNPQALAGLRRALGIRHLIVNAEDAADAAALRQAGFLRIAAPREVAELSLQGPREAWWAAMSVKWRNRLRHGQKSGLVVTQNAFRPDPAHWLLSEDIAQQKRLNFRALPHAVTLAMASALPGAAQLFTARAAGRPVAAMLFLCHGPVASYHIGWSSEKGRANSAHNLLLWQAMQSLSAAGHQRIDLGAHNPDDAPGLARFKRGSGARTRPLGGTWACSATLGPVQSIAEWWHRT